MFIAYALYLCTYVHGYPKMDLIFKGSASQYEHFCVLQFPARLRTPVSCLIIYVNAGIFKSDQSPLKKVNGPIDGIFSQILK